MSFKTYREMKVYERLANGKKNNHLSRLKQMVAKADTLIIVSPFVTDDIFICLTARMERLI